MGKKRWKYWGMIFYNIVMAKRLTNQKEVSLELNFNYPLERGHTFRELSQQNVKRFQGFLISYLVFLCSRRINYMQENPIIMIIIMVCRFIIIGQPMCLGFMWC